MQSLLFLLTLCCITACAKKDPPVVQTSVVRQARLLFVGDVMVHGQQLAAARLPDGTYDFSPCFLEMRPILDQADWAVANLETTLPGTPPYLGYPTFRSPTALASQLKAVGFDLLLTANNHANDAGVKGIQQTIYALKNAEVAQIGTYRSNEDRKTRLPYIANINELRIAFLNYTYAASFLQHTGDAVINILDENTVRADLQAAHREQPDMIIVCIHWGEEYSEEPTQEQEQWAQQLFRWGVDAVIGSHPHIVQRVDTFRYRIDSSQVRTKLVAYSLGNFISNQNRPGTDVGMTLTLNIRKHPSQTRAHISSWNYDLLWRQRGRDAQHNLFFSVLPSAAIEKPYLFPNEKQSYSMQIALKQVEQRLSTHAIVK